MRCHVFPHVDTRQLEPCTRLRNPIPTPTPTESGSESESEMKTFQSESESGLSEKKFSDRSWNVDEYESNIGVINFKAFFTRSRKLFTYVDQSVNSDYILLIIKTKKTLISSRL